MKRIVKILCVFLSAVMVMSIAACGNVDTASAVRVTV